MCETLGGVESSFLQMSSLRSTILCIGYERGVGLLDIIVMSEIQALMLNTSFSFTRRGPAKCYGTCYFDKSFTKLHANEINCNK